MNFQYNFRILMIFIFMFYFCIESYSLSPESFSKKYLINKNEFLSKPEIKQIRNMESGQFDFKNLPFLVGVNHGVKGNFTMPVNDKKTLLDFFKKMKFTKIGIEMLPGLKSDNSLIYFNDLKIFLENQGVEIYFLDNHDLVAEQLIYQELITVLNDLLLILRYDIWEIGLRTEDIIFFGEKIEFIINLLPTFNLPETTIKMIKQNISGIQQKVLSDPRLHNVSSINDELVDLEAELNIKRSFEILRSAQKDKVDVAILGAYHVLHILALSDIPFNPGYWSLGYEKMSHLFKSYRFVPKKLSACA